jgi:hypothetical protein
MSEPDHKLRYKCVHIRWTERELAFPETAYLMSCMLQITISYDQLRYGYACTINLVNEYSKLLPTDTQLYHTDSLTSDIYLHQRSRLAAFAAHRYRPIKSWIYEPRFASLLLFEPYERPTHTYNINEIIYPKTRKTNSVEENQDVSSIELWIQIHCLKLLSVFIIIRSK